MKNMKKYLAILLAVMMMLSLGMTVMAAGEGTITINGASKDNEYSIYRLLDLESYNTTSGAYSYKVNADWNGFFATPEALACVTSDAAGYVTWTASENDSTVAAFAKAALAYAKEQGIAVVATAKGNDEPLVFSNLDLGYYLVDSTMGALCGLTTTNPNASINAKNGEPTIDKTVQEDSTEQWGDRNTADIGQTVKFRTTISVHAGAENYVLHDKMSAGLTFEGVTKIEHVVPGSDTHTVGNEDYEVVTDGLTDGCTFEVRFTKDFCDHLETNDKVIVYYEAMLNKNAIVATDGNPNETWLDFGEEHHTTKDETKTYTFGFDIVKTDSQNTMIDGAQFKIYDAETGGNEVAVVLMADGTYRRAKVGEEGVAIVVKDGKVRVVGFDNGTYYLEETVAPQGYNKLTARQKFIISDGNLDAVFNEGVFSTGSGVHVVNKTGNMLPETGGFGTSMFLMIGGMLMIGAGVLLVTKRRMSNIVG